MFCDYCGNFLSDRWRFCPYCGRKIRGELEIDKDTESIDMDALSDLLDSIFRDSISGFSIRITSVGGGKPKIRMKKFGVRVPIEEPEEYEEQKEDYESRDIPRKVLEPEGRAQQIGQHTLIRVKLPGIKERDIDVQTFEESVEIKAYKDSEAYFKQFQIPQGAQILSQYMEGDELIVEVG